MPRPTEGQRVSQHRKPTHKRKKRASAKHRKPSAGINTTKVAVAAAGAVLVGGGVAQAVTPPSWIGGQEAALNHAAGGKIVATSGRHPSRSAGTAASQGRHASNNPRSHPATDSHLATRTHRPRHARPSSSPHSTPTPDPTGYANPFRAVSGLTPQRIDMGVDFAGAGPVYAIGDAVITSAQGNNAGWPGGGWITYQLTSGPAKGLTVYVAEDVTPTASVGEQVTSSTVIANMYNGGGIETGWAMPDSASAESQLAVAGGISGGGPFPTQVGVNFDELLQSLGVPAAYNRWDTPYGLLPAGYPTSWPTS